MSARRLDPERWLASPLGRWALALVLVLVAATVSAALRYEFITSRGAEVDPGPIFARYVLGWALWIPVGFVALRGSRWLLGRTQSLVLVVALNVPISILAAIGMVRTNQQIAGWFGDAGGRPERAEARGEGGERPSRAERRGEARVDDNRPPRRRVDFRRREYLFRVPRELVLYWFVLGLGASVAGFLRSRQEERRAAELELRAAQLRGRLADAQLASLQAQLHPHFLFNALHTVGGLVRADDRQGALKTLSAIGDLLRTTLDQGDAHEVPLGVELDVARRYLEIESVRFGDRLRAEWDVDEGARTALVPALFLLPLVENAVRHGVAPRTEGGGVVVRAHCRGARLVVEVQDDGPGFPERVLAELEGAAQPQPDARRGIGLSNTRARLEALYAGEHAFEVENPGGGGALVRVSIPLRAASEEDARG